MPWTLWTWLNPYTLVTLLLMATIVVGVRCEKHSIFQNAVIQLQDNGNISWNESPNGNRVDAQSSIQGVIASASRLTYWGLYLRINDKSTHRSHKTEHWVLRNECSEANYRRLAREIIAAQRNTNNGAN